MSDKVLTRGDAWQERIALLRAGELPFAQDAQQFLLCLQDVIEKAETLLDHEDCAAEQVSPSFRQDWEFCVKDQVQAVKVVSEMLMAMMRPSTPLWLREMAELPDPGNPQLLVPKSRHKKQGA